MRLCVPIIVAALSAAPNGALAQTAPPQKFHINSQRLQSTLEKLSEFGCNPEGGVTRLAYSDTELPAREYVIGLMKRAGLEVRADPSGAIFENRSATGRESMRPQAEWCAAQGFSSLLAPAKLAIAECSRDFR